MEIGTIIAISTSASALIISTLGWIITHRLNVRAQNINFINRVTNDARLETTKAIRDYQDWLVKVLCKIRILGASAVFLEEDSPAYTLEKIKALGELFFAEETQLKWLFCLEEYEILFPKTAKCRKDLSDGHEQIREYLSQLSNKLYSNHAQSASVLNGVITEAQKDVGIIADQIGLMEDLRIYLQNLCLSSLTGNKVPERPPPEPHVPRLVQDEEGNLHVFTPQKTNKNVGG